MEKREVRRVKKMFVKNERATGRFAGSEKENYGESLSDASETARKEDGIIAIGASTGGTEAIGRILRALPPDVPGIVVVQHIPPVFSELFAESLDGQTCLQVTEAKTGDYVEPGKVLIAPGDRHMRIKKVGKRYRVECFRGENVSGYCPSVDVLFHSVAKEAGGSAVGILLTGMGYDGAKGLLAMRCRGGRTIGQDEASCVVYGMPKVAFEIGAVEIQASPEDIPKVLAGCPENRRGAGAENERKRPVFYLGFSHGNAGQNKKSLSKR